MSDREEGELDSGEEEQQHQPPPTAAAAAKTGNRMDVSSLSSNGSSKKKGSSTTTPTTTKDLYPEKGNNDGRQFNSRKSRRSSKLNAFNEISNSKQKFVSRRVSEGRYPSPPPSSRTHYDSSFHASYSSAIPLQPDITPQPLYDPSLHPGYSTALPNLTEVSISRPSDSWRQDPMMLTISPRRGPLLQPPPPFLSHAAPASPQPAFFNQAPIRTTSFAPPPYRPSNSTAFGNNIPQSAFSGSFPTTQNIPGPLGARHSIDMEISPIESPMVTVLDVDEPLEESPPPPDTIITHEPLSINVEDTVVEPPIPYVVEHGRYIPQDEVVNAQTEEPAAAVTTAQHHHVVQNRAPSVPSQSRPKQFHKKFSKDFLRHIRTALLENLDVESESSSSSDFEEEAQEISELRRRLVHHNKEMHDELDKRERLVKEMDSCQLMINHHYERMNTIMKSIGDLSRQSVRQVRRSLSRSKSEGRKKREMLCNNFEHRVTTILNELSAMNEEVAVAPPEDSPPQDTSNITEKANDTSHFTEGLGIEDSGIEFVQSMDDAALAASTKTPMKRVEKHVVLNKGFQNECLQRMFKARYGIQPLPHVVVEPSGPTIKNPSKKKNSNASTEVADLEREEALRRKLLEQMKKKEQLFPSLHEKNKDVEMTPKNQRLNDKGLEVIAEPVTTLPESSHPIQPFKPADVIATVSEAAKEVENSASAFKLFKPADVTTAVPVTAVTSEEKPIVVPTMKDILEMKKEVNMALSKRRSLRKQELAAAAAAKSLSSKNPPVNQNSDASVSSKTSTPVKVVTSVPKPMEKENVGNNQINLLKRAAPSESNGHIKKIRSEEKSKCLDEAETREHEILFNSPRVAVRNFILLPEYPIKESIERLRHRSNPDVEMCYFQIFGVCMDDDCPYQHQRDFTLNDQQILEEILGYIPQRKLQSESIQKQAQKLLQSNSLEEIIEDLRKETSHLDLINLAVESIV